MSEPKNPYPQAPSSPGQEALDKLLKLHEQFAAARTRLKTVLASIGSAVPGPERTGSDDGEAHEGSTGRAETRFFPGLATLTDKLARDAAAIEADIAELERRF
jgi:hypothetical protein